MRSRELFASIILFLAVLFVAGCAGPLKYSYEPPPSPPPASQAPQAPRSISRTGGPLSVMIEPFKDTRDVEDTRTIGEIKATVANISGTRLILSEEPSRAVTAAFAEELASAGYTVETEGAGADYILGGELREFRLDIASRDEISIELAVEIKEGGTGRSLWSGVVKEEDSRYAGVMGNSRGTISKYISYTLAKAVREALAEAGPHLAPTDAGQAQAPTATGAWEKVKELPGDTGRLVIKTEPARARVYLGDVYYGLTPLTLDIEAGVHELTIRLEGYNDFKEKVAVGAGRITELETNLGGE